MPPLLGFLLALLAVYAIGVTLQMRRALRTPQGPARLREAVRLLGLVTLGAPLAVALVLAA